MTSRFPFDEDLHLFFCDFGEEIQVGSPACPITGIFDNQDIEIYEDSEAPIVGHQPMVTARTEDVDHLSKGSPVEVRAQWYKVMKIVESGTGLTELYLRKA